MGESSSQTKAWWAVIWHDAPNPAHALIDTGVPLTPVDDLDFDPKEWILRNIYLDDPMALRRNALRGWAEAAGFENIDVGNLGDPNGWELRFSRGTNAECTTAAVAARWIG